MDLKIFTHNIDEESKNQIDKLLEQNAFKDCKIRIMPDVHAGKGCVIGFTANLNDKIIPNIVGVDIGCGMLTTVFSSRNLDLDKLNYTIKNFIPVGRNKHNKIKANFGKLQNLYCYDELQNYDRIKKSLGTLGGGNHFIEIDMDTDNNYYLIIHSGSRNLGVQIASLYQKRAINYCNSWLFEEKKNQLIQKLQKSNNTKSIQNAILELQNDFEKNKIPAEMSYIQGRDREEYLNDMSICQEFAYLNRETMANIIIEKMEISPVEQFHTIHNYIDIKNNITRKGAISALKGEKVLIPLNMRDGCIVGVGRGNKDWNYSAPHGAGRIMSRMQAKELLDIDEYKKSMQGIFCTTIQEETIDEAPMCYKPMKEILEAIKDTVDIKKIIKPIFNYKACN